MTFLKRYVISWMICICLHGACVAQTLDPREMGYLFDWQSQGCERWDIVDTPARAWRDDHGTVHVMAGAETSRASTGRALEVSMDRDCAARLISPKDSDPAKRNDRLWIASVFTMNGANVQALVHAEYHGHRHAGRCAAGSYMLCWRNAIIGANSSDGGRTFTTEQRPIAALPYVYDRLQVRRSGYFNPSNMFLHEGWLYAYFFAEAYKAQKRGVCLMRRRPEDGSRSWRFWNGSDFTGRFADPYRETILDPGKHVCSPLPRLQSVLSSVIRRGDQFLAVTPMTAKNAKGEMIPGIWTMQSQDLVHWSPARLLMTAPLLWRRDCALPFAVAYPSLLDPQSTSRMFDVADEELWLTYVRISLNRACKATPQRDLVVHRLSWPFQSGEPTKER